MREKGHWIKSKHHHYIVSGKKLVLALVIGIVGAGITYITVRLADPYLFESNNFLDPHISKLFLENLKTLNSWSNPVIWFPPGVQWINKPPVSFALFNLAVFGLGIPYFILSVIGIVCTARNKKLLPLSIALVWAILFFLYQSVQFTKNMRYFIIIYPFLAITAAIGFHALTKHVPSWVKIGLIALVLIWPAAFISIYLHPHSRVQASSWIYRHIPPQSAITFEHWDDALPLQLPNENSQSYLGQQLPVFDPDTPEKWQTMNTILLNTDYYILSSNRAWGSIPSAAWKYPLTSKFYAELFAGKRGFTKVAEITSYPSLRYLGIPIDFPDDISEEAFTVYDHPKVIIFKRDK